jgi:hypothetical protein
MEKLSDNFNNLVGQSVDLIPKVLGAILVLLVGYIIAKGVQSLVREGLRRLGLDRAVNESPAGNVVGRVTSSPAAALGSLTFWVLFLGAISLAVSVLGIDALNAVMGAIYSYLPNVLAAFAILVGAVVVSAAVGGLTARAMGDTPTGKMVAGIVPGIIFSMAIFMVLNQLQIAPAIVTITYAALLGAIALGSALAFGLGGRDVAARMLETAYTSGQTRVQQARQDLAVGRQRAGEMTSQAQEQFASSETGEQTATAPTVETPAPQAGGFTASPSFGESIDSFKSRKNRR